MKFVSAKLVELVNRIVKFDKSLNVYANGYDNAYPDRVERIINSSATAKPAIKIFRKYIVGKGLGDDLNEFITNSENQTSLLTFLFNVADSYAYQNGVFIHVNYNLNHKISSLKVLPYNHCRIGKKDDKNWSGKILVYDNWLGENGKIDKNRISVIDAYNPNKKVIQAQIDKAGGIKNYKGQIFFYNPEKTVYPLSHIDNVLDDADSEYRVAQFKNLSLRKGFFGKKIVITPPMISGDLRRPDEQLTEYEITQKRYETSERDNFRKQLQGFIGADNVDGSFHMEMEFEGDDIEKTIKFIDVNTNINDKLFAHTETSVSNNIAKALGVPSILINNNDNSIFGNSGALLESAKEFLQEQREEDIMNIENGILNPLLRNFEGFPMPNGGLKIIPLVKIKKKETETQQNQENATDNESGHTETPTDIEVGR